MTKEHNRSTQEALTHVSGVVYGVHIQGELPTGFQPYLLSSVSHRTDPEHTLDVSYQPIQEIPEVDEFWVAERRDPRANSRFALFKRQEGFGLTIACQGRGLFRFTPNRIEIEWLPGGTSPQHYFYSHALPLWLEFSGIPVLHASAVSFGDRAVAFVGHSGIGKSTLCAGLVRSGCGFVADDGLPLSEDEHGEWCCHHGPPLFRLWPSSLEHHLEISPNELPRVHDSFEKRVMPLTKRNAVNTATGLELAAVYVLERQLETTDQVTSVLCTASESLVRLVEYSLAGAQVAALGLTAKRLKQFSRLVRTTQVRYLNYPGGSDQWQRIREAIVEDLEKRDQNRMAVT
jgi:hypothetical protein